MPAPGAEPTPWELRRSVDQMLEMLARIEDRMLTKDRFDEHQRNVDRRVGALEKRQAEWEKASQAEHVAIDARVAQVRESLHARMDTEKAKREDLERASRDQKVRNLVAVGLAVLAGLFGFANLLISQALGGS